MQRDAISTFIEHQGHEPWRRRNDRVTMTPGHDEPGAIASALWKRLTACREHDRSRMKRAGRSRELKAIAGRCDIEDPLTGQQRDADTIGFPKQRVEHLARPIAVRKEFAAGLFVNVDAELTEKCNRLIHRKRPQHATDDRRSPAPEIALGDDGVGEVAARSAADEDLGARLPSAFDQYDRSRPILSSREDRGCEAGCAGADNRNVVCKGSFRQRRQLNPKAGVAMNARRKPATR